MILEAKHVIHSTTKGFEDAVNAALTEINGRYHGPQLDIQYTGKTTGYYSALILVHDD